MPGIVSSSSGLSAGSVLTYNAVFTSSTTSTAINWVTGSTSTATSPVSQLYKGVEVTFQNISTGNTDIWIGGADVAQFNGIWLSQQSAYTIGKRHAPSAIQLQEWYVWSTSSSAKAVCQIVRAV